MRYGTTRGFSSSWDTAAYPQNPVRNRRSFVNPVQVDRLEQNPIEVRKQAAHRGTVGLAVVFGDVARAAQKAFNDAAHGPLRNHGKPRGGHVLLFAQEKV